MMVQLRCWFDRVKCMTKYFEEEWRRKLQCEQRKVLIWERWLLPPVPEKLTEEGVVRYIQQINPQLRRGRNKVLWSLSTFIDGLLAFARFLFGSMLGWGLFVLLLFWGFVWIVESNA